MTEQEIYDRLIQRNPKFAQFDMRTVMDRLYARSPKIKAMVNVPDASTFTVEGGASAPVTSQPFAGVSKISPEASPYDVFTKPGVAPALAGIAAAPFTAGMSIPAAMAIEGAVAGGAELGRQKWLGQDIDFTQLGKEAGMGALGVGVARGAVAGTAKLANALKDPIRRAAATMMSVGKGAKSTYESIARALEGEGVAEAIKETGPALAAARQTKPLTRLATVIEKKSVEAMDDVQNMMEAVRNKWGKAVQRVDESLISRMGNKPVDVTDIAAKYYDEVAKLESDEGLKLVMRDNPELKKAIDIVFDMGEKAKDYTIKDLISIRRALQEVVNWKKLPVGPKVPDAIEALYKSMRADVADRINKEAVANGVKTYKSIYNKFHQIVTDWDTTLRKVYGSADEGDIATKATVDKFMNFFNRSGYNVEVLEGTAKHLGPVGKQKVERLLNYSAARNILAESGGVSSELVGIMRRLTLSPTVINAVRKGTNLGAVLEAELSKMFATGAGATAGTLMAGRPAVQK